MALCSRLNIGERSEIAGTLITDDAVNSSVVCSLLAPVSACSRSQGVKFITLARCSRLQPADLRAAARAAPTRRSLLEMLVLSVASTGQVRFREPRSVILVVTADDSRAFPRPL